MNTRKHISPIPPKGECKIAFVGEAPSSNEIRAGKYFVGPAGKLLRRFLTHVGINAEACLITNVFDFELPKNNVKNIGISRPEKPCKDEDSYPEWWKIAVDSGTYLPGAIVEEQLYRLHQELLHYRPNVVIALGATAAWALCGIAPAGKMKKIRGSLFSSPLGPPDNPFKVIPTYHPAYILRSYGQSGMLIADLDKARRESAFPGIRLPKREVKVCTSVPEVICELSRLRWGDLAVDIETRRGQVDCIGFAPRPDYAVVVPFSVLSARKVWSFWNTPEEEVAALSACIDLLLHEGTAKTFQNGCVPGDTEVLTPLGWRRIDRISFEGEKVAQWKPENEEIVFSNAFPTVDNKSVSGVSVDMDYHKCLYTENHRIPHRKYKQFRWDVCEAKDIASMGRVEIPTAGYMENKCRIDRNLLKLLVAIQADAHLPGATRAIFNLKKARKINRLIGICGQMDVDIYETKRGNGERSFTVKGEPVRRIWGHLGKEKLLPWWLVYMCLEDKDVFLEELFHWDGWRRGRGGIYMCSKRHNLDVVSAVASTGGWSARVRANSAANTVFLAKTSCTSIFPKHCREEKLHEEMYCLATETGYFLARREGKTFITGNSYDVHMLDALWGIQVRGWVDDTRLLHHARWPELASDLGTMASMHLTVPAWKLQGKFNSKDGG